MIRSILIAFVCIIGGSALIAQNTGKRTILEQLRATKKPTEGSVRIVQDPRLDALFDRSPTPSNAEMINGELFMNINGFRIQIISANNQRESKNEADSKEHELQNLYPNLDTYVTFQPPFWKLRVGNFRTSEEAHAKLRELKKSFPQWKEMFIVRDIIKIPLYSSYTPN